MKKIEMSDEQYDALIKILGCHKSWFEIYEVDNMNDLILAKIDEAIEVGIDEAQTVKEVEELKLN